MASKAVIICVMALLIQTAVGQCLRNTEVTTSESCDCNSSSTSSRSSSSSSNSRSSNGSGSVRAIGIGCFKGGNFVSGASSSNTESTSVSSSNSESSSCSVCNAGLSSSNAGLSVSNTGLSACDTGLSSSKTGLSLSNTALSTSNAGSSSLVSGSPFIITCYGPIAPSGISVNAYSDLIGNLLVSGELPFLTAVEFDGAFQNAGTASVSYGCGDGNISIQKIVGANPGSCGYII